MYRAVTIQRGTTLIELVAAIVIVAIATVGLMLAISTVTGHSADPMVEQQAVAVAEAYLEEIVQAGFCDPDLLAPGTRCRDQCNGPVCSTASCDETAGGHEASRGLYDDICDYDALVDVGARDRDDNPIGGLEAYGVSVAIEDSGISLGSPALDPNAGEVVRIEVTVSHPGLAQNFVLSSYRANTE